MQTESKHTPGPWSWGEHGQQMWSWDHPSGKPHLIIQHMGGDCLESEQAANRALLAAAPAMYEALKAANEQLCYLAALSPENAPNGGTVDEAYKKCHAALALAEKGE